MTAIEALRALVEDFLGRASIAAERKHASRDECAREFYSGQASAFELCAMDLRVKCLAATEAREEENGNSRL